MASEFEFDVFDDQKPLENSDDAESLISDAGSCVSDASYDGNDKGSLLFDDGMIRLSEDDTNFSIVEQRFMSSLRGYKTMEAYIEAIYKVNWLKSRKRKARFQSYNVYEHVLLQTQCDGACDDGAGDGDGDDEDEDGAIYCTNYAWFCDSKQGIQNIISNGFGYRELIIPSVGIHLSPMFSPLQSLQNCEDDEDGLKHVLLCKVLMNTKEVANENFPNQYVVPETKMNSHILPSYVVTFRVTQSLQGLPHQAQQAWKKPASPWLPFATLLAALSKFLPRDNMRLIIESHKKFKAGKLSRRDWINDLRRLAGTDLLVHAITKMGFNKEMKRSAKNYSRKGKRFHA